MQKQLEAFEAQQNGEPDATEIKILKILGRGVELSARSIAGELEIHPTQAEYHLQRLDDNGYWRS